MFTSKPSKLVVIAWLSLAVSFALGIMPILMPDTPVGAIIALNWVLFMLVSYIALLKPLRLGPPLRKMEPANFSVWRIVFLAFTAAGWVIIMMGQRVV